MSCIRLDAFCLPRLVLPGACGTGSLAGRSVHIDVVSCIRLDAFCLPRLVLPGSSVAFYRGVGTPEGDVLADWGCLAGASCDGPELARWAG